MLCSSTAGGDGSSGGGGRWEIKKVPIKYQSEEFNELYFWLSHAVVPFKNSLCWVNYYQGIIFCDDVFGDTPKVSYHRLPLDSFPRHPSRKTRKELYRGLCVVTNGGGGDESEELRFVDVARDDGVGIGQMAPSTGFTIASYIATRSEDDGGSMQWSLDADRAQLLKSLDLWAAYTPVRLPRDVMTLPLLSVDDPDVAHLVFYRWQGLVDKVSLVTVDLKGKRVVGSVVDYIKGEEDLATDDADMIELKPYFFTAFLPTEFPKFLKPSLLCDCLHSATPLDC